MFPNFRFSTVSSRASEKNARLAPGFRAAAYLLLVLFSAGFSGDGALFSGCEAAGITGGEFTSGFGVSASRMIFSVIGMTFHVQPKNISRQKVAIARTVSSIEAALRLRAFTCARLVLFSFIEAAMNIYARKQFGRPKWYGQRFQVHRYMEQ